MTKTKEQKAAYMREYRKRTPDYYKKHYIIVQRWRLANEAKRKAHGSVNTAINNGNLIKPSACSVCLGTKEVFAHHKDYSQKLNVLWLCDPCHKQIHMAPPVPTNGLGGSDNE